MEPSYSKYQLWSPLTLDLSLDSFSNDLIQEFDKTRSNIDTSVKTQEKAMTQEDNVKNETETIESLIVPAVVNVNHDSGNPNPRSVSPVPSSITLPASERETSLVQEEEEDVSTTGNLFRKSSTFLKKKLSQNGGNNKKDESSSISTTSEEITNIVSRQYPPKPLQYSPVIEPPSNNISASTTQADLSRNSREVMGSSAPMVSSSNRNSSVKRISDPTSVTSNSNATTSVVATTTPTTKRRSFFSLRFC